MKIKDLIYKNIIFFSRYFKQVALGILISVAVITGSLVIGDSVRTSLIKNVNERLGDTETVIFANQSYLSESFCNNPLFESSAKGVLLTKGFISYNGILTPVMVWGVNDINIDAGDALINNPLFKELGIKTGEALVLRLPAQGLVPSGSMFVTENYTSSLRLNFRDILSPENGGNISLKNEQILPFNIFVNRSALAREMKVEGKINLILSNKKIESNEIEKAWNYQTSGLSILPKKGFYEIVSDRIFIQEGVIENIVKKHPNINRVYSYLANSITNKSNSIPYSFVTALDYYKNRAIAKDEVILSDYSANRLKAKVGDLVYISYYTSKNFKTLQSDSILLRVKSIVPLSELKADTTLSANFPGLSDVESCTEWDSDLPINMDLIYPEDEKYWELYRSTPKAILPYEAIANKWGNAFGYATSIRITENSPDLSGLTSNMFDVQVFHPKEAGIYAAKNGVDFAGLFMALGFFIIISSILLMIIPVSEMIYQRKDELNLLKSLGYTRKRIRTILWYESAPVVIVAAIIGVTVGLMYTTAIMWLLGNFWKGATHTEGFSVYPNSITILIGFIIGVLLSLFILFRVITRQLKEKKNKIISVQTRFKFKKWLVVIFASLTLVITLYNLFVLSSVVLFSIVGITLMITFALFGDYYISVKGKAAQNIFSEEKAIWRTLYAHKKQTLLSYFALAFGVFIVFSVGLNRQGFSDSEELVNATGGYSLWCESSIPVYHNINTQAGKEKLNLLDLPEHSNILQCLRFSADKANCLNLNKVSTPSVLGIDFQQLFEGPLQVQKNIYSNDGDDLLKQLKSVTDSIIPALVDATVLQWSLEKSLGDTIYYKASNGQQIGIQLAGTLPNTIFQGYILIDQHLFSQVWPNIKGSEIFLAKINNEEVPAVKTLISQAMHEYGMSVTTTNERMKQFNTVTDTYLTIFITLGGIGLLLGIMAFVIVIRKNLSTRKKEIELYSRLGFNHNKTIHILYRENIVVPIYAIITGLISAYLSVGTNYSNANIVVWLTAFVLTLIFIGLTLIYIKRIVKRKILDH